MFWRRKTFAVVDHSINERNLEKPAYFNKKEEEYVEVLNNINDERKEERRRNPFLGLFYANLFSTFFVISSVLVQKLSYITPGQLTFVRNAGVLCGSLPIAVFYVKNILGEKKDWIVLITRSFIDVTALHLSVTAFAYLPLSDAAILLSITPAVTAIMARFYLKESFGLTQSVSIAMTLIGVLLSILPDSFKKRSDFKIDNRYFIGIACAAGSVLLLSVAYMALRKMKDLHFSVSMIYFGFIGMIENAVINGALMSYDPVHCGWDKLLYILVGVTAFIGNSFLTLSLQVETAGIVSVVKSSMDIINSIIFQIIFFSTYPDKYKIIGGFIIILSMSILGVRTWLLSLPKESESRKVLKFLLL